jgi:CIC family chloride channel protein
MTSRFPTARDIAARWIAFSRNEQVILTILAIAVGAVMGYGTIAFRELLSWVEWATFGFSSTRLASLAAELAWWHVLIAPAAGGLLIGLFLRFVMPGGKAVGVAQVMEAAALKGARIPLGQGIAGAAVAAASLGVGASAGREGPVVHLGATIGSFVAHRLRLGTNHAVTLLGCGVASAVAASFNAPIAGAFFALEVVIGHYALRAFTPIVLASVAGTIVSRVHLGDFPAFIVPSYRIVSFFELLAFFMLGIVCAAVAIAFMRSVVLVEDSVARLPVPSWILPGVAGLIVGGIAVFLPEVLGVGYEATDNALKGLFPFWLLVALLVAKIAATAVSIGGGFGGGVFSPSLFVGAMTGGAYGILAGGVFPELASTPGLYAMVGMGAVAAPVLGAPISTVLMVFELIGDFSVTVASMTAVAVASVVTHQVLGRSHFTWQLARRGVSLRGGRVRRQLLEVHVRDIMGSDFQTIPQNASIASIRRLLQTAPHDHFFVVGDHGQLFGTISFSDVREIAFDTDVDLLINARDAARRVPHVRNDDNLEVALATMDASGAENLPVVDASDNQAVVGILHHNTLLREYNRALLSAHAEEHDER